MKSVAHLDVIQVAESILANPAPRVRVGLFKTAPPLEEEALLILVADYLQQVVEKKPNLLPTVGAGAAAGLFFGIIPAIAGAVTAPIFAKYLMQNKDKPYSYEQELLYRVRSRIETKPELRHNVILNALEDRLDYPMTAYDAVLFSLGAAYLDRYLANVDTQCKIGGPLIGATAAAIIAGPFAWLPILAGAAIGYKATDLVKRDTTMREGRLRDLCYTKLANEGVLNGSR